MEVTALFYFRDEVKVKKYYGKIGGISEKQVWVSCWKYFMKYLRSPLWDVNCLEFPVEFKCVKEIMEFRSRKKKCTIEFKLKPENLAMFMIDTVSQKLMELPPIEEKKVKYEASPDDPPDMDDDMRKEMKRIIDEEARTCLALKFALALQVLTIRFKEELNDRMEAIKELGIAADTIAEEAHKKNTKLEEKMDKRIRPWKAREMLGKE
jgi:hypothetical protein